MVLHEDAHFEIVQRAGTILRMLQLHDEEQPGAGPPTCGKRAQDVGGPRYNLTVEPDKSAIFMRLPSSHARCLKFWMAASGQNRQYPDGAEDFRLAPKG
jgi:hypothetical protein